MSIVDRCHLRFGVRVACHRSVVGRGLPRGVRVTFLGKKVRLTQGAWCPQLSDTPPHGVLDKCGRGFRIRRVDAGLHPEFLMFPKSRRYLVGVSGGRDSVALLHLLLAAGYRELVLCHLNHGLRGGESDADAAFVRRLAEKNGLPCEAADADVAERMSDTGESMELAARNARRAFFARCAERHGCPDVLLGHHADDQAETVLFNLLRGSAGLRGMRFLSRHTVGGRALQFIRPLLATGRDDIDRFLTKNNIAFREDTSNAERIATRNRLRHEVLPLLDDVMGRSVRPALVRAAEISESQEAALQHMLADRNLRDPQGRLFLPEILRLPPALRRVAVHGYLKQHEVPDITSDLLQRCLALLDPGSAAKVNLPGSRFLRRKEKRLFIE